MIISFASVSKQNVRDFENGEIDESKFIEILAKAERIGLSQIDRAANILAGDDEFSKYWEITGAGEILAGGNGEALIIDPVSFEDEDGGGFEICDPAVYMMNEEVKEAAALLAEIDENQFKAAFDAKMKKLTKWSFLNKNKKALKESAPEIFETFWDEVQMLRDFYQKTGDAGNCVVIFVMYEDADFE
ncbi:hypothetical protein MmiEs2_02410 [Methanimicrococcus stummii]|uniref:Uncharacterized protein n=1 Tax=Methanimicrococcus stummii TaxID=3028294 RepID=A0AA96V8Y9_9EURY|nr:DUF1877 family protein [Methanimicrococcus sp. Es2]WNY28061.1 hypothetical protein MmiEs2_02410 [Methanimicrococcus sp. Es2]